MSFRSRLLRGIQAYALRPFFLDIVSKCEVGDVVINRWLTTETIVGRSIRKLCGSIHSHDEPLGVWPINGVPTLCVNEAIVPRLKTHPLLDRETEHSKGELAYGVLRWYEWCDPHRKDAYTYWKHKFQQYFAEIAAKRPRYDIPAIFCHLLNYSARKLAEKLGWEWLERWLSKLGIDAENKIFCTELTFDNFKVAGTDLNQHLHTAQKLVAPCHIEELYYTGWLRLIHDGGIESILEGNRQKFINKAKDLGWKLKYAPGTSPLF